MDAIKATSEAAYLYLTRIPLESWTVHKFDNICKTDHITNNVVEAFNSWLNKFRTLPMLTLMERVRQKLMKRINDRLLALHLLCLKKFQKEKEMRMVPAQHSGLDSIHVGPAAVTSRNAGAVSGHGGNASNNSGPGTTIGLGGPSTCASGTITRVLWFPPTQEGNSIPRDATNNMSTQPFTQGAVILSSFGGYGCAPIMIFCDCLLWQWWEQEKLASVEARAKAADVAQKQQVQFENSAAGRAARA
ncbi:hypothetical protein QYF36_015773 [Acer negundo]|nr:hypothetical protein QYF36_015773 [Acer negundo]